MVLTSEDLQHFPVFVCTTGQTFSIFSERRLVRTLLSHQYLGMVYKLGNISILMFDVRTGSIASRAKNLDRLLQEKARGRGINFMAHSMGGLDCRYLITHVQPSDYIPLSLTTISTPHRGSPFMDWCAVGTRHLSLFCPAFTSLESRKISASGGSRSKTY